MSLRGRAARLLEKAGRGHLLALDYPIRPEPRYGYGKPAHPVLAEMIEHERDAIRTMVESWELLEPAFRRISIHDAGDARAPYWVNGWLPAVDLAALFGYIATGNPKRYVEIGSGQSTKVARRAIEDAGLTTSITSIDPHPRTEIDAICDRMMRVGLEHAELAVFRDLQAGDIVFLDGSHRCFTNSDVAVFFLDILPQLAPGVLVQVHDVYLPFDYPRELTGRYYSEQYLLAVYLLASASARIVLPNAWISHDAEMSAILKRFWDTPGLEGLERWGASFWFRTG